MENQKRELRSMKRLHADILRYIESNSMINKNTKVLDCACGSGNLSESLLQKYTFLKENIYMVDIDDLKIPVNGAKFVKADLNSQTDFEDNYFDLIISLETIEHIINPNEFIIEMSRILTKNGTLIISTPNIHNIFSRILFLCTGEFQWYRKWSVYKNGGHISPIYHPCFCLMAERNNLKIVEYATTTARLLGTKVTFPLRGFFWGEILIYSFKK